jgi:hypothetical protein
MKPFTKPKLARPKWTRLALLKRDIRSAATRSKKKGTKVSLANKHDEMRS